jgi:hypothetical protein
LYNINLNSKMILPHAEDVAKIIIYKTNLLVYQHVILDFMQMPQHKHVYLVFKDVKPVLMENLAKHATIHLKNMLIQIMPTSTYV